jgi:hypothetical protein
MELKNAIACLAKEYGKLDEPWVLANIDAPAAHRPHVLI